MQQHCTDGNTDGDFCQDADTQDNDDECDVGGGDDHDDNNDERFEADEQNYHDYHDDNEDECDIEAGVGGVHSRPACRANRCGWMVAHYRPQSPNIDHYFKIGAQYSTWCSII